MRSLFWGFLLLPASLLVSAEDNSLSQESVLGVSSANADDVKNGEGVATGITVPTSAPTDGEAKPLVTSDEINSVEAIAGSFAGLGTSAAKGNGVNTANLGAEIGGIMGSLGVDTTAGGTPIPPDEITTASQKVSRGMIEGFMNGKIDKAELACLEQNVGYVASDTFSSGEDLVKAVIVLIPKMKAHENFIEAVMGSDIMGKVTDAGSKIMDCVGRITTLAKGCVKDDAMKLLNKTAKHLMNLTYVSQRLVVNTVNITEFLADSIVQWEEKDYQSFGNDIGTTMRKILIENGGSVEEELPEGIPPPEILEEVLEGTMMGYFVQGTTLDIKDKSTGQIDMEIDLKKCIADNHLFFRSAWKTAWFAIAQAQTMVKEHEKSVAFIKAGLQAPAEKPQGQPQFIGEGMMALAQVPTLLMNCNINSETKEAFSNGQETLQDMSLKMNFPNITIDPTEVSLRVEQAAKFWEEHDFDRLGIVIGLLMRDLTLITQQQKYEYSNGILRLKRYLMEENSMWHRVTHPTGSTTVDGGIALLAAFVVALVACRAVRVMKADHRNMLMNVDEEAPLRSASHPRPPTASSSMLLADVEVVEDRE